eukprot:c18518_g1_i1 orf=54-1667(+)
MMEGMGTPSIPLQLIDDDEFQALEVAIAAAECSAVSTKKPKISSSQTPPSPSNPTTNFHTDTVSAFLCEPRTPDSGYPSGFANGLNKGACRFVETPRAQAPYDLASPLHSEALNEAAEIGASCFGSSHASKEGVFSGPSRSTETISADQGGYLQSDVVCDAHSINVGGGSCSCGSSEEAFFETASPSGAMIPDGARLPKKDTDYVRVDTCKALNADSDSVVFHPNTTDKLFEDPCSTHSGYLHDDSCRQSCSSRRLPSWQCPAGSHQHENSMSSGPAEIKQSIRFGDENRAASNSDLPEALSGDESRVPWGLAPPTCKVVTKCKLPSFQYKGRIIYSDSVLDAENAAHELLRRVEAKKVANGGSIPLGFDTEWKVIFRRGAQRRKVSVLQLCIDVDNCNVFHVIHSGIPGPLKNILEDPLVSKVGVGAFGDAAKLCADYNIKVRGVKDLSGLANLKLVGASYSSKSWSLSSLAEKLLGKQVDKTGGIRMGDWEVEKLSEAQLQYAATDAFASLYLFQVLLTYPDPQKKVLPDVGCSS